MQLQFITLPHPLYINTFQEKDIQLVIERCSCQQTHHMALTDSNSTGTAFTVVYMYGLLFRPTISAYYFGLLFRPTVLLVIHE